MSILERTVWIDKSVDLYVGELIEYDMREGGFSIIQKEKLLPDKMIENLKLLTKKERHEAIGKLAYNKEYRHIPKLVTEKFAPYRIRFGEMNGLVDDDIFYIRKDAVCVKKYCYETHICDFIEFREKKVYNCFIRIEPPYKEKDAFARPNTLEFYWSSETNEVDVKGIKDDVLTYHRDGILLIVSNFMRYLYSLNYDGALRYIISVMDAYKQGFGERQDCIHPEKFYRRFDSSSKYHVWYNGAVLEVDDIGIDMIPMCDKAYNYRNILVPMLNFVTK